jgi:hypothetical protein
MEYGDGENVQQERVTVIGRIPAWLRQCAPACGGVNPRILVSASKIAAIAIELSPPAELLDA